MPGIKWAVEEERYVKLERGSLEASLSVDGVEPGFGSGSPGPVCAALPPHAGQL